MAIDVAIITEQGMSNVYVSVRLGSVVFPIGLGKTKADALKMAYETASLLFDRLDDEKEE